MAAPKTKKLSPEHRAKISAALKGRRKSRAHKKALRKWETPAMRKAAKAEAAKKWAQSEAGRIWLKANLAKKNAARKAWREMMRLQGKKPS
jgi:hypothetical protein